MKNLIKMLFLILIFGGAQSCTDLLNKPGPSLSTSQETALGTPEGVKAVRAYMYSLLHSFDYTTEYMLAPAALADNLFIRPPKSRFKEKALNAPGNTTNSWETSYEMIQQANLLIDAIKEDVLAPDLLAQYRGEGFFMRAFAMHHLARTYGYEPKQIPTIGDGAGFNLSIVIRTDPILGVQDATFKARGTIAQTYEQIESDLLQAIDLFSQGDAGVPYYATQAAAEALLARVYLYWGKYDLADQYASDAISHTDGHLATPSEVGGLFEAGTSTELIFQTLIDNPAAESQGVDNALASYTSTQYLPLVPTQDLMDLYSVNDARLAWFAPCFDETVQQVAPNCFATHPAIAGGTKLIELHKYTGDLGTFADNVPLIRVAEMVLIQAEARLNTQSAASAITRLNDLRNSRGLADYSGGTSETDVLNAILDARRREFVGEGMRFFDLKRLGRDIRKAPGTTNQFVQTVPYSNRKVLARMPTDEIALSQQAVDKGIIPADSALVQNPGYQ